MDAFLMAVPKPPCWFATKHTFGHDRFLVFGYVQAAIVLTDMLFSNIRLSDHIPKSAPHY